MAQPRRTSKPSKQAGGTFLGIVLGLIVGLAIAVVVALYITRAPSPFVSKVAPPADNASGASQPQQFDPNRALQGKTPGQPVPPQAAQPAPPNTAPGQAANQTQPPLLPEPQIVEVPGATPPADSNGVAVAPKPADSTPPAKKPQATADNATSQPKAAQQPPKAGSAATAANPAAKPGSAAADADADANSGYFLQVGAYKTEADAEQQRARLGFQGFESKVSKRDLNGVTYYRVRVGPFNKFDDMNSARQRLSDAGVDTAVIRFTKQ
ncbi:SPOR domain-containing protein [Burkholderia glumae]|uniref:SPOR domain-containing protein n=1 Tax=Burkholderia glumae TaxID=337 RepID=UPI000C279053|nr:SPOR domain-containing protein [Burkholderia glumae]PJO24562.1 cell division protein [Burkholderia glumae AU6208]QHE10795.1 cell division protein [Burkholderia glumae AU6208]